jgi:branched-subunit amino acid ABC-type transport system permease component
MDFFIQHFGWISNPTVVARQALAGLSNGMLLFIIAAGLSLIFGVSRIINFAHGTLFMFGAYLALTLGRVMAHGPWSFALSLAVATLGLFMSLANPRISATHFAIYVAATNVTYSWTAPLGGIIADNHGYTPLFVAAAVLQVATIALLWPLDTRRAARTYAAAA